MKKKSLLVGIVLLLSQISLAQNLISPFIKAYPKESYGHGTQNWEILQNQSGLLHFANNDGLLNFDGYEWSLYPLSNRTILRAILEKDEKIYAGGQNEIGYYHKDISQGWAYTSLKEKIPLIHQTFEDVWDIVSQEESLFFRSSEKIFVLKDQKFEVWNQEDFLFLDQVGTEIISQARGGKLFKIKEGELTFLYQNDLLDRLEIRSIIAYKDGYLIATLRNGIYALQSGTLTSWEIPFLTTKQPLSINHLKAIPNGGIAISTSYSGLILYYEKIKDTRILTSADGLPGNGVIVSQMDNSGNLWVGMENGLAMIEISGPTKSINLVKQGFGVAYDLVTWRDHLYIGTNSGLYKAPWPSTLEANKLVMIPGSQGQVWGLQVIEDRLFMPHANGLYEIKDGKAEPIYNQEGSWLIKESPPQTSSYMLGTYRGLYLWDTQDQEGFYPIPDLAESCRFLEYDAQGAIWMSHPYRGVFRINTPSVETQQVELLGTQQGLPSNLHNHIFKINQQVIIAAERGLYYFDDTLHQFKALEELNRYFPAGEKIRRLAEAPNGDIWFISESEIGYLKITEIGLKKVIEKKIIPNVKRFMNGGWEKIYPLDENNVFITSINGLLHINPQEVQQKEQFFPLLLNTIQINKDSVFYPLANNEKLQFSPQENDLFFEVAAIQFAHTDNLKYQYYLEGFDKSWTTPDHSRTKEYTNLPYRKYTLKVRALDPNQQYSETFYLDFEVLKPWYLSMSAKIIYACAAIFLTFLATRYILFRFNTLKNEMAHTVKKSKEEIRRLENERIQAELDHKKRELVSTTIHIAKKNETIQQLTEQLSTLKKEIQDPKVNKRLHKVIHFLKTEDKMDENWDQLLYHFNELHPSFFDRLKAEYSALTPKDLKLCAYLKMNLSTKEMVSLMNVSVRGIEASRYRLRKRLNLDKEVNLNSFFMNY